MKIAVLDGHALNPGDLSWDELRALGECVVYPRTPPEQVMERAAGAEAVLTNKTVLTRAHLEALPDLRYVGVLATGYNVVDVDAARARGIAVTNVPGYGTPSVAQMTMALLLELTLHVGAHAQSVREGQWSRSPDFAYWNTPLTELSGLTLGIVGFGDIGQAVARLAQAFGMTVLAHRRPRSGVPDDLRAVRFVERESLLRESDVVSLHCPLTPETAHLIDAASLALMRPSAFLLNTSRGGLVDAPALAEALTQGRLAGAALDVLETEPPPADNPLLRAPNCLITPHIAWATRAARERLLRAVTDNLRAFQQGEPRNRVA